jgi:MFS family permease
MPYGVVGSFTGMVMPYLARRAGIEVEDIGWFVTLLFVPTFFQFIYAPVVDFWMRRKHWLVTVATVGALCQFGAYQMSLPDHLVPFLIFAFAAQAISGLVGACNGGLLATTIPDDKRGKAGAWYNIGNLSGGGVSGALAIYMTGHGYSPVLVGGVLAAMMILPSLAILVIDEPAPDREGSFLQALRVVIREAWSILDNRAGLTGLLLCLSPVGTAALANYFSAIAEDFVKPGLTDQLAKLDTEAAKALLDQKVSDLLAFVSGPVGQILTAVGAGIGGFLCDRANRRAMYLVSGGLTAVCGIALAFAPHTELSFTVGALVYALITGFCYASFTATVLETIGDEKQAASTRYSMFVAAGNAAIAYVGLVNTRFHADHGSSGVIASDAILNFGGVVILGMVFWRLGLFRRKPTASA